jgi:hypothetical protein
MNRFKKAGTILRAFSRSGDAKGLLNSDEDQAAGAGGEGAMTDSKHGNNSPTKNGEPVYNEQSAEPVSPLKGRRGGLLSALSDRYMLGGASQGYGDDLNTHDDDISDNLDDEGNETSKAGGSGEKAVSMPPEDSANRIGELPSKPSTPKEPDSADKNTANNESTQGRARRSQQAPGTQRRFRKTKAKEEATKTDNEDLEATVAQVDAAGEGGYSQLVLSERGEAAPEQSPELPSTPGPESEVSQTTHSAETVPVQHSTHGDDDSAHETDNADKPSPKEDDRGRGRSERTSSGTRPKLERGSSRKPQSRGTQKERPRKPVEKRHSTGAAADGSRRPADHRRSLEHEKRSGSDRPTTKGASEGDQVHRRRKSNDSDEPSTPTRGQKALVDGEEAVGALNISPKEPSAQKVKDSEKERSKDVKKEGSKAWPSARKVRDSETAKGKPKERELLQHLGKEKKKSDRGVQRVNSSKSLFVGSKKDKEGTSGEISPTLSVGDKGLRRRSEQTSQSENGKGLLGQMRSAVSERNLSVTSEHTPSVLGPGPSDSIFHSDHGGASNLDLGPLGSGGPDLGPAATDSATLMALTSLSWTARPPSPAKKPKPKPEAALQKDDVAVDKTNLFTSTTNGDSASGTPEKTGPDETVVVSAPSPDADESTKNKASKDGLKPRRDGKESSGPTGSSKRNESSSSKSKRDGKDEDGKSRDSRTRSRPESRQRGHSVNPEARSRGSSVRAQDRWKKAAHDAPANERRRRRPSMGGSGVSSERGSDPPSATAQIDSRSNDFSAGNVPTTPGPDDAGRQDTTSKAAEGEVAKEPNDLGSPIKKSPKRIGSPTKTSPKKKSSMETEALPQAPLSPSKQNGAKKPESPRHNTIPRSPRSPRRGSLGSPRRRTKSGSTPTGSSPQISLQLAMALTGPPNLDEGNESPTSEVDRSTDAEVAKIEASSGASPPDDAKSRSNIILSENGDEASEDPLFEDWSDAADDTSLLESFGVKSANLDRGSEHSSVTNQSHRIRVEEWSDAADESEVANLEETLRQSTIVSETVIRESSKQDSETNAHEQRVQESIGTMAGDDVLETLNGDIAAKESVDSASPKATETTENGEPIATDASTGVPLDDVANEKDEERVEEIPKRLETDESAEAARLLFQNDHEKQMKGVSLEVENEVPHLFMSDMVSEKSNSNILGALDKVDGTALANAEIQQQSTDSVDENQAVETEGGENKYASSSVYALLSSELAGSKERLAETRLEVSQLEKEVDLLRLRLNALEKTLS